MAGKNRFSDNWPNWAKPAFALAAVIIWVGVPMVAAWSLAIHTDEAGRTTDYQPILVVLVGMTTATITGIFVFMSFRIDRGTRFEAQKQARKVAKSVIDEAKRSLQATKDAAERSIQITKDAATQSIQITKETAERSIQITKNDAMKSLNGTLEQIVEKSAQDVDTAISSRVKEEVILNTIQAKIAKYLTEEILRKHIEAALLVEANGQVVKEYGERRATKMDEEAFQQLIHLLYDIIRSWSDDAPEERAESSERSRGWYGRLKDRLTN